MKTLFDKAVTQIKALPEERQNNYGEVLLKMLEQDFSQLQLDREQAMEVRSRLASPEPAIYEFEATEFLNTIM